MIAPSTLQPFLGSTLSSTDYSGLGKKYVGKVRDVYIQEAKKRRILIATDRQSAFDILWCQIPLKGQVLSELSSWWFKRIEDIMPTHVIAFPDPNVTVGKELKMLQVEIVVRGYLTGSSKTAAWTNYAAGMRAFCGNTLPDGMVKNQAFTSPIITPTTKGEDDELIDPAGIVAHGYATKEQWKEIEEKAFALFDRGQHVARERGLILVDTKYEMGYDEHGVLTVADEVHTPDSSRYWIAESYPSRFGAKEEPESLDKEFFRLWLRSQGFEYGGFRPAITDEVRLMLGAKYIDLYERVTGERFKIPTETNVAERIRKNLEPYMIA